MTRAQKAVRTPLTALSLPALFIRPFVKEEGVCVEDGGIAAPGGWTASSLGRRFASMGFRRWRSGRPGRCVPWLATAPWTPWSVVPENPKKSAKAVKTESAASCRELHGVKVVDVVAAHDEQHRPEEQLDGFGRPVEVPDRRSGSEAHRIVKPKSEPTGGQKGSTMRWVVDEPLTICIEHVVAEDDDVAVHRHHAEGDVG